MGFRFRKSVGNGIFRVNFSKSGVGGSMGVKGARFTKKSNGGTRSTLSIPGTGISYVSESGNKAHQSSGNRTHTPYFAYAIVLKVLGIPMIALSALIALALPVVGIAGIGIGIGELALGKHFKKKGIQQEAEEAQIQEEENRQNNVA